MRSLIILKNKGLKLTKRCHLAISANNNFDPLQMSEVTLLLDLLLCILAHFN